MIRSKYIKNNKKKVYGVIVENKMKRYFVTDIDGNDDGSLKYKIELEIPNNIIKNISNETLLNKIRSRMIK